jgi:hypothetical protein
MWSLLTGLSAFQLNARRVQSMLIVLNSMLNAERGAGLDMVAARSRVDQLVGVAGRN